RPGDRLGRVAVSDGEADPLLPEIDAKPPGHGVADPDGAGVSMVTGSPIVSSTRLSKLGIEPDQSGETLISTLPYWSRMSVATATGLPRTIASSSAGSSTAIWSAVTVTGKLTVWPTTMASPTSTLTEPSTSSWSGSIAWWTAACAMAVTGAESAVTTVPLADRPRSNDWTSCPTSVSGATVGVDAPRTPVAGKTVEPAGALAGSAIPSRNASWRRETSESRGPFTSSWVTRVNSSLRPPVVGSGLVTFRKSDDSPFRTIPIVPAAPLPAGPARAAV